jgi:hypothetical protein
MAELQTNLNVAPFFDDYDDNKQYYRILFRPTVAVQARELTQLQTILQRQISRFGDSIYKDGTIIEGCNFSTYPNIRQIRFRDTAPTSLDFGLLTINHNEISNSYLLVSNTTGLRAAVFRAYEGAESVIDLGIPEPNRAYVLYTNSGNNAGIQVTDFSTTSEQIDVYSPIQDKNGPLNSANKLGVIYTLSSNSTINALSIGYGLHVGQGVIYQKGFFLKVLPDNFVIREHNSNAAGMVVGFDTTEYIVTPVEDPSLNDNALGSPNYTAPGAYRLKLVPTPVYYDSANVNVTIPQNFLPILEYDGGDGRIVEANRDPQLSILGDTLAKRTSEESGDYVVRPFQIDVTAHESNNQSFYYNASPGIAYVDGYRVELLSPRKIEVPRAITTNTISNQIVSINFGNYAYINNLAGTFDYPNIEEVTIYDTVQETLTNSQARSTPSGTIVGKANIRGVGYLSGNKGTASAIHLLYIFNVRMNAGKKFENDARSFYVNNATYGESYADIVLDGFGKATIYDTGLSKSVFNTGLTGVKRLTNNAGVNDTNFVYKAIIPSTLTPSGSTSSATFTLSGADIYNYGIGFLTDFQALETNFIFGQDTTSATIITNATVDVDGSNTTTSNVISATAFTQNFVLGQAVKLTNTVTSSATYHTIVGIDTANKFTLSPNTSLIGNLTLKRFFKSGTHVDTFGSGNTVRIDTSTSAILDLILEPDSPSYTIYGQIQVSRNPASPIAKQVNKGRYVKIDCGTHPNGAKGPWALGFPDVYNVSNVFFGSTYSTANPDKESWFDLATGQTDSHYGISYLVINQKYASNLTNTSKLLVKLDHFVPQYSSSSFGFFSADSYPIDDVNLANPNAIQTAQIPVYIDNALLRYDLRNHIDFRFVVANTATSTTSDAAATINPLDNITSFNKGVAGNQFVAEPGTNFTYDVEYYLPRLDVFLINKDGSLDVKQGIPDIRPRLPAINKAGLPIAEIKVPPYPSLTFTEAE